MRPSVRLPLLIGLLSLGLLVVALYAARTEDPLRVLASSLMLAAAAVAVGGLFGFLFGVPRAAAGGDAATADVRSRGYRANTNLEQISDWLTKILVGVGLTQLASLRSAGAALLRGVSPALGGGPDTQAFAGALLTSCALLGFLAGWLITRLQLAPALSAADRALETLVAAEQERRAGNDERATELRDRAFRILEEADELPRRYESLRVNMSSSARRTAEMEAVVAAARRSGASGVWTADKVRQLFDTGEAGDRIYALGLMQGDAGLAEFEAVCSVVAEPQSRFEQYHAMLVALPLLPELDPAGRSRLAAAIEEQLSTAQIPPGSDREILARRILAELGRSMPA